MTSQLTSHPSAASTATARSTRALLACGVVAGPLFVAVAFAQAFLREGFELARHPLSLLSLGEAGWIQIANFVLVGVLFLAAAVGMRRVLTVGPGHRWGPRLIAVFGAALVAGGVFVADPAFGFPLGTPAGAPEQLSWHGIVHGVAPAVGFLALSVAGFVLARRDAARGHPGWAFVDRATGVLVLVLSALPNLGGDPEGRFGPLWIAMMLGFGWASATMARLRAEVR
jgi:hypothetical protein